MPIQLPATPIQYGGNLGSVGLGIDTQMGKQPAAVALEIAWADYAALGGSAAITFDLGAGAPAPLLDEIRSIRVSNIDSPNTIFILFPQTGQLIECPPGVTLEPVLQSKGNLAFQVFTDGLIAGYQPTTYIDVLNVNRAGYFIPDVLALPKHRYVASGQLATVTPLNFQNIGYWRIGVIIVMTAATIPNPVLTLASGQVITLRSSIPASTRFFNVYTFDALSTSDTLTTTADSRKWAVYTIDGHRSFTPVISVANTAPDIPLTFPVFSPEGGIILAIGETGGGTLSGVKSDAGSAGAGSLRAGSIRTVTAGRRLISLTDAAFLGVAIMR